MNIFFKDSRINLNAFLDIFTRLLGYSFYIVLFVLSFVLFFSDISRLRWLSFLFFLFLFDRLLHTNHGEKDLSELKGANINVALALTPASHKILSYAYRRSLVTKEDFYLVLILELLKRKEIKETAIRLDILLEDFLKRIKDEGKKPENRTKEETFLELEKISILAYKNALEIGERFIEPRNIFAAIAVSKNKKIDKTFEFFEVFPEDVKEAVIFSRYTHAFSRLKHLPSVLGGFAHRPKFLRERSMNRAWTARPTPILDSFSDDLTLLAKNEKIGFLIGHEKEFNSLLEIISRPGKPNAILVGEPGSGKTSIISHLAFKIIKDEVPPVLFDKRLVSLDVPRIFSNASQEILSSRLQKITDEIILAGNIVLVINSAHDLFKTTDKNSINAIDLILPVIKNEEIPVIAETYPREFKQFIEQRTDFLEQFEVVRVEEIKTTEAIRFLVYSSVLLEREFKVFITFGAIKKSVDLAYKYFRNKLLPGSAIDLLKQSLAFVSKEKIKILDDSVVVKIAEKQSRIPIQTAKETEAIKLLNLENIIHEKLIDQEEAVKAVSRAIREYRSGLSRKDGPVASFLFVGPTGVGKTELAKILAEIQFGSRNSILRFDMSEYQDKQSIFRFVGTPDGSKTGAITDAVLQNPYSLILLDEFEKANPDILNIFLQVFDDGRLTDSLGRVANFQNAVIIATSNAHSEFIKKEIEKGMPILNLSETLKGKLTDYFKPELLNRFSNVVVFKNLNKEETFLVAELLIKEVEKTIRESHGVELKVDRTAVQKISELGYSPVFGARPLRQVISEKIRGTLAEKILKNEITRGCVVNIFYENDEFNLKLSIK